MTLVERAEPGSRQTRVEGAVVDSTGRELLVDIRLESILVICTELEEFA